MKRLSLRRRRPGVLGGGGAPYARADISAEDDKDDIGAEDDKDDTSAADEDQEEAEPEPEPEPVRTKRARKTSRL